MRAALQLFKDIGIRSISVSQRHPNGTPMATCAGNVVERLIKQRGLPHMTLVLRAIVESEGNAGELISDIIAGVSDVVLTHPRWPNLGLAFIEAFDQISLAQVRLTAKKMTMRPLRLVIATLLYQRLEEILGPAIPPKPPVRTPAERAAEYMTLGKALLALKAAEPERFKVLAHERLGIDAQDCTAYKAMAVAGLYGSRPEITSATSWTTLCALSAPVTPASVRRKLEAVILTGQVVRASHVHRARKAHAVKRQADQPDRIAA